jgi:hypothetical protein
MKSVALLLALACAECLAQSSALRAGPQDRRCDAAWAVGPTDCARREEPRPAAPQSKPSEADTGPAQPSTAQTSTAPQQSSAASSSSSSPPAPASPLNRRPVTEDEVDAYLAAHGKPPREAVRAILDPTDANIVAYERRIQRDQAVAAYVAQRMDELRRATPSDSVVATDIPALSALRVRLHVTGGCEACDGSHRALQQLASAYPLLDVQVVYHGAAYSRLLWLEQARLASTLPARGADTEERSQLSGRSVPLLVVHDLRTERITALPAPGEYVALRASLLSVRQRLTDPTGARPVAINRGSAN